MNKQQFLISVSYSIVTLSYSNALRHACCNYETPTNIVCVARLFDACSSMHNFVFFVSIYC